MFSFRSCIVLGFIFRYDLFWVNFYMVQCIDPSFFSFPFFLAYEHLIILAPFVEKTHPSSQNCLWTLVKNHLFNIATVQWGTISPPSSFMLIVTMAKAEGWLSQEGSSSSAKAAFVVPMKKFLDIIVGLLRSINYMTGKIQHLAHSVPAFVGGWAALTGKETRRGQLSWPNCHSESFPLRFDDFLSKDKWVRYLFLLLATSVEVRPPMAGRGKVLLLLFWREINTFRA